MDSQRVTQQSGASKDFAKGSARDFSRGLFSQDYLVRSQKENPKIPKMEGKDSKYFSVENSFHLWG